MSREQGRAGRIWRSGEATVWTQAHDDLARRERRAREQTDAGTQDNESCEHFLGNILAGVAQTIFWEAMLVASVVQLRLDFASNIDMT